MYKGIPASEGVAIGKVLKLEKEDLNLKKTTIREDEIEKHKIILQNAILKSKSQLQKIQESANEQTKEILDAHIMILEDVELIDLINVKIETELLDSAYASYDAIEFFANMLESMDNEYMKERATDMRDIGYRLIMNIQDKDIVSLLEIDESVIIVAHDITPSDTAQMNKEKVFGFLTNIGGRTSHSAIMARTLEIPAILGLNDITQNVKNGDIVCFDGEQGVVFVNPDQEILEKYRKKQEEQKEFKQILLEYKDKESKTSDNHKVEIAANIGKPEDSDIAHKNNSDGIGLYRTEFLYMDRENLPTEEEQFEAYKYVLEKMQNKPVVIRTLDIGGDKKLPYLELEEEMNPFLGYRAIRICLDRTDLFKTQLRALLRASVFGNLKIMYPMISSLEEVRKANKILDECKKELDEQNIKYGKFEVGIMIEIPSAAISSDIIAKEVDFFSIGTNDLIQYTCAVDRMNQKISDLYNSFNPAVLRLIKMVIDNAHKNNIWCGMCGETAGDKRLIPIYLGMGLDEFSMSASSVLKARKQISEFTLNEAKQIAEKVLSLSTSEEIEEYIKTIDK